MMAYAAGLRVGEVVRLRLEDIDRKKMLIHVRGAKGFKDRYTVLAESLFETYIDGGVAWLLIRYASAAKQPGELSQHGQTTFFLSRIR